MYMYTYISIYICTIFLPPCLHSVAFLRNLLGFSLIVISLCLLVKSVVISITKHTHIHLIHIL